MDSDEDANKQIFLRKKLINGFPFSFWAREGSELNYDGNQPQTGKQTVYCRQTYYCRILWLPALK